VRFAPVYSINHVLKTPICCADSQFPTSHRVPVRSHRVHLYTKQHNKNKLLWIHNSQHTLIKNCTIVILMCGPQKQSNTAYIWTPVYIWTH